MTLPAGAATGDLTAARQRGGRQREPHARAIYAAVAAAYLGFAGIGIVDPILPVIAVRIGVTAWQVELLFTAYVAVMAVGMIPAVLAASRWSNKRILLAGLGFILCSALLAAFSQNITELASLRGTWGLGNAMFFATAMTIVVSLARDSQWAVGRWEAAIGLGLSTGPLIGGLLGNVTWRLPFFACGVFMLVAFLVAARSVREPERRVRPMSPAEPFRLFGRARFAAVAAIAATYNFCFFIILGYTPLVLGMSAIPLGLVFTAWGVGVALGILVLGHPLAHRIGYVHTVGAALAGILACLVLMATSAGRPELVLVLVVSGVCIGLVNATLTDLALGLAGAERGVTTGAFNLVRWGGAAVAPVVAGLLGEHVAPRAPYWLAAGVLALGLAVFAWRGHHLASGMGERVLWARWSRARRRRPAPAEAEVEAEAG
jgi:MFS transporter, ACDE family, multidrug resistance protein